MRGLAAGGAPPGPQVDARWRVLLTAGLLVIGLLYGIGLGATALHHIDESHYLVSSRTMVETGTHLHAAYEGRPRFQNPIVACWPTGRVRHLACAGTDGGDARETLCYHHPTHGLDEAGCRGEDR